MLESLLNVLCLYGSGALTCLAICTLYVATTPRFTQRMFTPHASCLGIGPRALVVLGLIGCAAAWPWTYALVWRGLLRSRA
ncbi:hypothetical protein [Streptosporangium carneum]|uniref:Uncharacterized protein n=1 Tax=Streptosporangium carneum TaxID=47481 RepID=A0A9W6MAS0_9ACTN|nr:hypothetical protein [Streptosporangium carneum]GLK07346.1 hypothetical protein GCM10017600_07510 [Streptosporangium carneum]